MARRKRHRLPLKLRDGGSKGTPGSKNFDVATVFYKVELLHESFTGIRREGGAVLRPGEFLLRILGRPKSRTRY